MPDDAGVYRLDDDTAIVQTVDFFTPIVDDPYAYGQIAAANALSDLFAMGARPLTALALLAYPTTSLPREVVSRILQGGQDKIAEAGAAVIGGHTIDDDEPKFGYAVTGVVHPGRLLTKAAARPGDVIVLTKPVGVGVLTTALRDQALVPAALTGVVDTMCRLNTAGTHLWELGVRATTDITGFGLLGHVLEMATESRVGVVIEASRVPVLPLARELAEADHVPGGTRRNAAFVAGSVDFDPQVDDTTRLIMVDAVTSGGLLIASPPASLALVQEAVAKAGSEATVIGRVTDGPQGRIHVRP